MFRGKSVKYIFLAITYICSSYITEEEKRLRETAVSMLSCGTLERNCGTLCFQESERNLCYVDLIGKKTVKKGWGNGKKCL